MIYVSKRPPWSTGKWVGRVSLNLVWCLLWNPKCIRQMCHTSKSGKCAPVESTIGIWWGTRQKMRLAFLSNGSERNLEILLGWDKSTKNPLRSWAPTLDECALAVEHCVTVAKEWWKTWMIFPVTRVCLSTPKSTTGVFLLESTELPLLRCASLLNDKSKSA